MAGGPTCSPKPPQLRHGGGQLLESRSGRLGSRSARPAWEDAVAWDFSTEPEFQEQLDWVEQFAAARSSRSTWCSPGLAIGTVPVPSFSCVLLLFKDPNVDAVVGCPGSQRIPCSAAAGQGGCAAAEVERQEAAARCRHVRRIRRRLAPRSGKRGPADVRLSGHGCPGWRQIFQALRQFAQRRCRPPRDNWVAPKGPRRS